MYIYQVELQFRESRAICALPAWGLMWLNYNSHLPDISFNVTSLYEEDGNYNSLWELVKDDYDFLKHVSLKTGLKVTEIQKDFETGVVLTGTYSKIAYHHIG